MIDKQKDNEHQLFQAHMEGVTPLKKTKTTILPRTNIEPKLSPIPKIKNQDPQILPVETNFELKIEKEMIRSKKKFQPGITISYQFQNQPTITAEAILEFGLDHLSLAHQDRLKKGLLNLNARIDLHGKNREQALEKLAKFIEHAHVHHNRNLLIIHGKGAKHGDTPILKQEIYYYLIQHAHTLALRSAQPKHGGSGAIYLVLKKNNKHD
jgi:DNA-nicking Smr family endonuclease